jgi:hypothetical protein
VERRPNNTRGPDYGTTADHSGGSDEGLSLPFSRCRWRTGRGGRWVAEVGGQGGRGEPGRATFKDADVVEVPQRIARDLRALAMHGEAVGEESDA